MATFNIDTMKSGFKATEVHFRGEDYELGKSALGILTACEIHGEIEELDGVAYLKGFMERMPKMLTALCETFPTDDLDTEESMALMKVITEVLSSLGQLGFSADENE